MNFPKFILILKKEILGTDIKAILKNQDFKQWDNDPRIFANTMTSMVKLVPLRKYFYSM